MKQRITVTVDSDSYQLLKAYDVNISGLVSTTMQNEARRLRAERRAVVRSMPLKGAMHGAAKRDN